jgi:hypothetical protein
MAQLTYQELKVILKSPENKKAEQALEIIRSGKNAERLLNLLPLPAAFLRVNPAHPRSQFFSDYLLDECYKFSEFGVVSQTESTFVLGAVGESPAVTGEDVIAHKLHCWNILLDNGIINGGENNWRGNLSKHVLSNTLSHASGWKPGSHDGPEAYGEWHIPFALKLLEKKPIMHIGLANDYHWIANPDKLKTALTLGMDPLNPQVFLTACGYLHCDTNGGDTKEDRINVLREVLRHYKETGAQMPAALAAHAILYKDRKITAILVDNQIIDLITEVSPDWKYAGCVETEPNNEEFLQRVYENQKRWEASYENNNQPSELQRSEHFALVQEANVRGRALQKPVKDLVDMFNERYKPQEPAVATSAPELQPA